MCSPGRRMNTPHSSSWLTRAALAATLATHGCAGPLTDLTTEIPRRAVPAAVKGGVDAVEDAATRRRIEQVLASPEMRAAERDLVAGVVDGALDTLGDRERQRRIAALAKDAAEG